MSEPITAEALSREPGWEQHKHSGYFFCTISGANCLALRHDPLSERTWISSIDGITRIPGITTMPQLRALVAALRGEPDPRIARLEREHDFVAIACEQITSERDRAQAQARYWQARAVGGRAIWMETHCVGNYHVWPERVERARRYMARYEWAVQPNDPA